MEFVSGGSKNAITVEHTIDSDVLLQVHIHMHSIPNSKELGIGIKSESSTQFNTPNTNANAVRVLIGDKQPDSVLV